MDTPGLSASQAGVQDAAVVAQLLHAFNTEFEAPTPSMEILTGRFTRLLARDDVQVLLVRRDGEPEPRGFAFTTVRPSAYCDAGVGMLEELYVRPEHRGGGAGTVMVQTLWAWLRDRGVDELQVNVDEVDVDARRFYVRHGFTNLEDAGASAAGEPFRMLLYVREA